MKTILVVDDEPKIVELARDYLEHAGFAVVSASDGPEALTRARGDHPDLIVLDLGLPRIDGLDVARALRRDSNVPIVILSGRSDESDKLVGLELGADDYVTKPFELPELVARIKAVLRRSTGVKGDAPLAIRDLEIDPGGFTVRKGGAEIALTATEFRLLLELARRPRQVFTRELLLELVWNYDYLGDSRLVDAAVQRLRTKVEDDPKEPALIKTVRGVGYRLDPS